MELGEIFYNNKNEAFKIISFINNIGEKAKVKIEFLESKNQYIVDKFRFNRVPINFFDTIKFEDQFKSKIYPQNCGDDLKIIEKTDKKAIDGSYLYKIKFIKYPYERFADKSHILEGKINNPFVPNKFGFYLGNCLNIDRNIYKIWKHLQQRKISNYAEVSKIFKSFENFQNWYIKNIYNTKYILELDKDILSNINHLETKIYSPETCLLIPSELNCWLSGNSFKSNIYLYNKNNYISNLSINKNKFCFKSDSFKELKFKISKIQFEFWKNEIEKYEIPNDLREILLKYDFSWSWIWENMTEEEIREKYYGSIER